MGALDKYLVLWAVSLGSSVGLLFIAFIVTALLGESGNFLVTVLILTFNMTAIGFIILTTIPAGILILSIVILYDILSEIAAPILQIFLNTFGEMYLAIVNWLTSGVIAYTYVPIAPTYIDPIDAMTAFVNFLLAYKDFLITSAPTVDIVSDITVAIVSSTVSIM